MSEATFLTGPFTREGEAFRHIPSGMLFPPRAGMFARVGAGVFNGDGTEIGVGYDATDPAHPAKATIYVYPAPEITSADPAELARAARADFDGRRAGIEGPNSGYTDLARVSEAIATLTYAGREIVGWRAAYRATGDFGAARVVLLTEIAVFSFIAARWSVQYRFTRPADDDAAPGLDAFRAALPVTITPPS